jgi:phytoene dehydrogenase-like protein
LAAIARRVTDMGDWIRLWYVSREVPLEFNLDHVRVARPEPDGTVALKFGDGRSEVVMRGFLTISELREAGRVLDAEKLPRYTHGPDGDVISRAGLA